MNGNETVNQNICVFSRKRMELSGIDEVESFTDNAIVLRSKLGSLSIEGEELKIERFSTECGELVIVGHLDGVFYFNSASNDKRGFFSRLLK